MQIFIPTRDRIADQHTWANLTDELRAVTKIVCPESEVQEHRDRGRNAIARPPVKLSAVRQWLMAEYCDKSQPMIMLDDDLGFFRRISQDAYNLEAVSKTPKLNQLFSDLNSLVSTGKYPIAGISPRQMNQRNFPHIIINTSRINAVHCIDPWFITDQGIRYDDVDMMEDYHVVLSLLERGYDNAVIVDGAWDQVKGSGAPGGFSHYRNKDTQAAAAHRLAELHPNSVTVVEKTPKTGQGDSWGGTRTDVRVGWQKAYESYRLEQLRLNPPPPKSYRWDR